MRTLLETKKCVERNEIVEKNTIVGIHTYWRCAATNNYIVHTKCTYGFHRYADKYVFVLLLYEIERVFHFVDDPRVPIKSEGSTGMFITKNIIKILLLLYGYLDSSRKRDDLNLNLITSKLWSNKVWKFVKHFSIVKVNSTYLVDDWGQL